MRGSMTDYLRRRPLIWAFTLLAGTGLAWQQLGAVPKGPQANDRQVTRVVSALMLHQHLSKHLIDDEISERVAAFAKQWPGQDWRVCTHLGPSEHVMEILADRYFEAVFGEPIPR